jgi:hypothetical protein
MAPWLILLAWLVVWPLPVFAEKSLERDDQVLVFQTMALREGGRWVIPVHGRVYEPEHSVFRRHLFASALDQAFDIRRDATAERIFSERVDWFVADGESGRRVWARVAGQSFDIGVSDSNGYFFREIRIAAGSTEPGTVQAVQIPGGPGDGRVFEGRVIVPAPDGVMVVSDIDDTVKVSNVIDRERLIENTFYREFVPAPALAALCAIAGLSRACRLSGRRAASQARAPDR